MNTIADECAFPCPESQCAGLTKREYMAAKIMAGFAADPGTADIDPGNTFDEQVADYARCAVQWADHLIDALNAEASPCSESESQPSNRSAA